MIRHRDPPRRRSVKHDVVMDALRGHGKGKRAAQRLANVQERRLAWLDRQGAKAGFEIRSGDVAVDGSDQHLNLPSETWAADVVLDP